MPTVNDDSVLPALKKFSGARKFQLVKKYGPHFLSHSVVEWTEEIHKSILEHSIFGIQNF